MVGRRDISIRMISRVVGCGLISSQVNRLWKSPKHSPEPSGTVNIEQGLVGFDDHILLPDGRKPVTLNAGEYIAAPPPGAEETGMADSHQHPDPSAEGRDFLMHARITVLKAIGRDREAVSGSQPIRVLFASHPRI